MITFLPFPDFAHSANSLDWMRRGRQRGEALCLANATLNPHHPDHNHPACVMWHGYTEALCVYGMEVCKAWCELGHSDGTWLRIQKILESINKTCPYTYKDMLEITPELLPPWLGDERVHQSHRSRLIQKDLRHYRAVLGWDEPLMGYYWPNPRDYSPREVQALRASLTSSPV